MAAISGRLMHDQPAAMMAMVGLLFDRHDSRLSACMMVAILVTSYHAMRATAAARGRARGQRSRRRGRLGLGGRGGAVAPLVEAASPQQLQPRFEPLNFGGCF